MFKRINESFKENINQPLLIASFAIYLIILTWIIIFKCCIPSQVEGASNQVYKPILTAFTGSIFYLPVKKGVAFVLSEICINFILFLPLGLYLPILFNRKNLLRDILITIGIDIFFETIQLFTRMGLFSLLDVLWNTIGMLIGEFIYFKIKTRFTFQVINYIQFIVVILFLPVAIYAIVSVPLNWDIYSPFFDFEKYPYILS